MRRSGKPPRVTASSTRGRSPTPSASTRAHWIGTRRPGGTFSSVEEIQPPVDLDGNYLIEPDRAFGGEPEVARSRHRAAVRPGEWGYVAGATEGGAVLAVESESADVRVTTGSGNAVGVTVARVLTSSSRERAEQTKPQAEGQ